MRVLADIVDRLVRHDQISLLGLAVAVDLRDQVVVTDVL